MATKPTNKKKKKPEKKRSTRFLMMVWLASALAFAVVLALWTVPSAEMFARLEVDPPALTVMMLAAGTWLTGGINMLIATGVLVATVLPFMFGMKGKAGARLYGSLMVVGCLAIFGAWFGLKRPMDQVAAKMESASPR